MQTLDRFEKFALLLIASVVMFCFYEAYISLRDVPVPPHFAPMVIPGPTVVVVQPQYVDRVPNASGRPIDNGMQTAKRYFRHLRSSCDAECRAYRKAYRNAAYANALLGEQRYDEGPYNLLNRHTL